MKFFCTYISSNVNFWLYGSTSKWLRSYYQCRERINGLRKFSIRGRMILKFYTEDLNAMTMPHFFTCCYLVNEFNLYTKSSAYSYKVSVFISLNFNSLTYFTYFWSHYYFSPQILYKFFIYLSTWSRSAGLMTLMSNSLNPKIISFQRLRRDKTLSL